MTEQGPSRTMALNTRARSDTRMGHHCCWRTREVFTSDSRAAMVLQANTIPQYFRLSVSGLYVSYSAGSTTINGYIDSSGASASGTFAQNPLTGTWSTTTTGC